MSCIINKINPFFYIILLEKKWIYSIIAHTHAQRTHKIHTYGLSCSFTVVVSPVFSLVNEPAAVSVLLAMNEIVYLGVSPFVSFLSDLEIPDAAGERLVEAH